MIYDCFSFFNELDILELRLETLDEIVDNFVLVEATKTHSNNDKPLYYNDNKERFQKWNDKIIHIIVDDYPEFKTSWTYENYQRNCIMEGLKNCQDDDVIIISDVDEIPRPEAILKYKDTPGIKRLEMKMYYFYLNYVNYTNPKWSYSKMLHYRDFSKKISINNSIYCIEELNRETTPTKIRVANIGEVVPNAGWHFSYLGDLDNIIYKITSFSHQEKNTDDILNRDKIISDIKQGRDIYGRNDRYMSTEINKTFPSCIYNNSETYSKFICNFKKPSILNRIYYIAKYNIIMLLEFGFVVVKRILL